MMILLSLFFFLISHMSLAAENKISDAKFVIEKEKKKELFDIERFYFFPPMIQFQEDPLLDFSKKQVDLYLSPLDLRLKILKAKNLHLNDTFNNLVSGGMGYENNYGVIGVCNIVIYKNFKNTFYSFINFATDFPGTKKINFIFDNELIIKKITLNAEIQYDKKGYKRLSENSIGNKKFKKIKDDISEEQYFDDFTISLSTVSDFDNPSLKNTFKKSPQKNDKNNTNFGSLFFNFYQNLNYNYFSTKNKEKNNKILENHINLNGNLYVKEIKNDLLFKFIHSVDFFKTKFSCKGEEKEHSLDLRNLLKIGPSITFYKNNFNIDAGFFLFGHNEINTKKKYKFSPLCTVKYKFYDKLSANLNIGLGSFKKNSYKDFMSKNPLWILKKDHGQIKFLNNSFYGGLGLVYQPIQNISIDFKINSEKYLNFQHFIHSKKRYKLNNTEVLIVRPELDFNIRNKLDTIFFNVNMNYNHYVDNNFKEKVITYEPMYNLNFNLAYSYLDKIFIKNILKISGGRKFNNTEYLDNIIDYGIGLGYNIIDSLVLNIDFENILLRNNEIFEGVSYKNFKITLSLGYKN